MISRARSRAMRCMAALAFSLTFAPAPILAQERSPQDEPQRGEAPRREQARAPDYGPKTARATAEAAQRYADIAASRGWPRIARPVDPDSDQKAILQLRRRLAAEDYLAREDANEPSWDDRLEDALKRFQTHVGLEATGTMTRDTLRELNVSATARARQLEASAQRLSKMKFDFPQRYVSVNIPAASVEAVENGELVQRYDAIVGGKKDPSPEIVASIVSIDVNPTWTVPSSIIRKELAPKLKRNPKYFEREKIRVFDSRGREVDIDRLRRMSTAGAAEFTFRQDPGPKNALGSLRISMPNKEQVYMHDTPKKELFERDYRFMSHGCVRVEGVYDLAAWLLQDPAEPQDWDEAALRDKVDEGKTEKIKLRRPVPVAWVYMTGWASPEGVVNFRRDIYGLDKGVKLPPRNAWTASR